MARTTKPSGKTTRKRVSVATTAKAAGKRRPPPGARVRLAVDDRRAQLLALGVIAFSSRGYDDVSIEQIAAEAGISRGLLFHYFPSKRDFFVATVEMMAARMLAETVPAEAQGDYATMLANGLDRYFGFVEQHADMFVTLLNAGGDHAAGAVVDATRREYVRRIRAFLPPAKGREEARLRTALNAWERMVEGIALDWLAHRDLSREEVVQLALRGALIVPGTPFSLR